MRINHNLLALQSRSNLNRNLDNVSKSTEKLSSGLRINRAADDAAGLSITQKMRAQIRGLHQAERNISDGISLLNTAEGGVSDIEGGHLQRVRELLVQASNDTLTPDDRLRIQEEIDASVKGIDAIAQNTEFNGMKLLNDSLPHLTDTGLAPPAFNYENVLSLSVTPAGKFTIATDQGYPTTANDDGKILMYDPPSTTKPSVRVNGTSYFLNALPVSSSTITIGDTYRTVYSLASEGIDIIQDLKIVDDKVEFKYAIENNSGVDKSIGFQFHMDIKLGNDDHPPFWVGGSEVTTDTSYAGGSIPSSFEIYNDDPLDMSANPDIKSGGVIRGGDVLIDPDQFGIGQYFNLQSWGWTPSGSIGDSGYALWWNERTVTAGSDLTVNTFYGLSVPPTVPDPTLAPSVDTYQLKFQVGPNENNHFRVSLTDARPASLGIDALDVSSYASVQTSLEKVDSAISFLSSERAKYGAYGNALEHIKSNVTNAAMNLTSSESRIADADLARETVALTKDKILQEASQAMLAQANQFPQGVLQLLK